MILTMPFERNPQLFSVPLQQMILNHLWQSTVVVLCVWMVSAMFRRNRAGVRFALWMAASAKFLVPFSLLVAIGQLVRPATAHFDTLSGMGNAVARSVQPYTLPQAEDTATALSLATAHPVASRVPFLLLCLWAAGTLVMLASWLRSWLLLRAVARRAQPVGSVDGIPILQCESILEPGAFGIACPRILIPLDLLVRMSPAELEAIYAHEMCHVRRRDNLFSAIHALIHALFWFHPAMWLIRARLIEERELACDEHVLACGNDADAYARSILNVCRFYVEGPVEAMAGVTGGELKRRIQRIVAGLSYANMSGAQRALIVSILAAAVALPLAAGVMAAQASPEQGILLPPLDKPLPEFAAATIKPASVRYFGIYTKSGGRVIGGNCSVICIAQEAFHLQAFRIVGGPEWVKSMEFDLEAVPPDDSLARQYNPGGVNFPKIDEQRLMLQALLRDRFGLKYHVEQIDQPVFFLQRTGKPLRLLPPKDPKQPPFMSVNIYSGGVGSGELEGDNTNMAYTAFRLGETIKTPVIDQTGITGSYDFLVPPAVEKDADIRDSTFEGLKKLGLELKPGKAPIDTIVIDAISKPTPN